MLGRGLFVGFTRLFVGRCALHAAKHLSIQFPVQGTIREQLNIQKQFNILQPPSARLKRVWLINLHETMIVQPNLWLIFINYVSILSDCARLFI